MVAGTGRSVFAHLEFELLNFRLIQIMFGSEAVLRRKDPGQKNAGLKVVTLIATLNPVSQVLW